MERGIQCMKDWEPYKHEILRLYFEEGLSLKAVSKQMSERYQLRATDKQYKRLVNFKNSRKSKNIPASVWIHVREVLKTRDREGKQTVVLWDGKRIGQARLRNEMSRYQRRIGCSPSTDLLPRIVVQSPVISPVYRSVINPNSLAAPNRPATNVLLNKQCCASGGFSDIEPSTSFLLNRSDSIQIDSCVEWEGLSVCSDLQSEHDYGNLSVIDRLQTLLHGIPMCGVWSDPALKSSDIELLFTSKELTIVHQLPSKANHYVPRGPDHTWVWESLTAMLASVCQVSGAKRVPGCPKSTAELLSYTKTDILNIVMNLIINMELSHSLNWPFSNLISEWCMLNNTHHFLRRLVSCQALPGRRLLAFATGLIRLCVFVYPKWMRKRSSISEADIIDVTRSAFNALERRWNGRCSSFEATMLLQWTVQLNVTDIHEKLISYGATVEDIFIEGEDTETAPPATLALLLRTGADPQDGLRKVCSEILNPDWEDPVDYYQTFCLLLAHGADPSKAHPDHKALSIGELAALASPDIGRLLLPYVRDKFKQEMMQTIIDINHGEKEIGPSRMHREFALLVAVYCGDAQFAERLLSAGSDPDCLSLLGGENCKRDDNPALKEFRKRAKKFRIKCLLDHALSFMGSSGLELARVLLNAGASFSVTYLRDSSPSKLRYICKSLTEECFHPNWLPYTQTVLLELAIRKNDHALIDRLLNSGVDLSAALYFGETKEGALGLALSSSKFKTVELVWSRTRSFRDKGPIAGTYELIKLFKKSSNNKPKADFMTKFEFLMAKGASVSGSETIESLHSRKTLTPLEALLLNFESYEIGYDTTFMILKRLIDSGAQVNHADQKRRSPLQIAADRGLLHVMKYLIDRGAEVEGVIGGACWRDRYLHHDLRSYPLPGSQDERIDPWSPLGSACLNIKPHFPAPNSLQNSVERENVVDLLFTNGIAIDSMAASIALVSACYQGCLEGACLLLERGVSVEPQNIPRYTCIKNCFAHRYGTPLQMACSGRDRTELVRLLLKHGADPNATSLVYSATPLQIATIYGDLDLASLLVNSGATANDSMLSSTPALYYAIARGHFPLVLFHIESGADIESLNCFSSKYDSYSMITQTCSFAWNVTAIQLAAWAGHYDIVQLIVNAGAETTVSVNRYSWAIFIARKWGHIQVVELLESHSQPVSAPDDDVPHMDLEDDM